MTAAPHDRTPDLISSDDFAIVADLIKSMSGIYLDPNKKAMVSGRLAKRLRASGIDTIRAYCTALRTAGNCDERDAFISALTTNMTRFTREARQFEHLSTVMLPELAATARSGGRVRIWSAGCSSGEEAYDLAFRVLQACPEAPSLDVRILATDIDPAALATARAGIYPQSSVTQLPAQFTDHYFDFDTGSKDMVQVARPCRELISFHRLNLNSDWPFQGKFDVIMCRNVAIYFDTEIQNRLWRRLAVRLHPHGALYAGHSEALPSDLADCANRENPNIYRFPNGIAAARPDTQHTTPEQGENL